MKYLSFFFFLTFIFACGDSASTPASATTDSEGQTDVKSQPVAKTDRDLESPDISITIEGMAAGQANLIGMFTDQYYKPDSAQVAANGTIRFKRDEPYNPGYYYVQLPGGQTTIQLIIDADQTFSLTGNINNLVNTIKVEGSEENRLLYETLKFEEEQRPKFNQISQQMRSVAQGSPEYNKLKAQQDALSAERKQYLDNLFTEHAGTFYATFKEAGQNPSFPTITKPDGTMDTARHVWTYRSKFWDGVDFSDERLLWTPVISNKLKRYINELTPQQPDSIAASAKFLMDKVMNSPEYYKYFANWIVLNYEPTKTTLMDAEAVYVFMIENYFTYDRAFWSDSVEVHGLQLRAYEMTASLVGKKGPNITVPDLNGTPRTLYDMKADYILVYMWNPECEHCAEQTPKLVQNYNSWKKQGIDIYGIAVNTEMEAVKKAVAKYGMQWTNVFDPSNKSIYATYYVNNTPELYVLNPDRTIIGKNLQWDQVMTVVNRDKSKRR
jgi:peroxiredoxin